MPDWLYIFIIIYLYLWIFSSSWSYLNLFRRSMKVFWVAPTNVFVPLARTWYKLSVSVLLPLSWLWELQSPDLGELTSGFQWAHKSKTNITLILFTVMSYWIISKDVYLCYFSFEVWTQTASEWQPLGGFERKFSSLKKKKKNWIWIICMWIFCWPDQLPCHLEEGVCVKLHAGGLKHQQPLENVVFRCNIK